MRNNRQCLVVLAFLLVPSYHLVHASTLRQNPSRAMPNNNVTSNSTEETPLRKIANESRADKNVTSRNEPKKRPDWLGQLRNNESRKVETESSTPPPQAQNRWPESVTRSSNVASRDAKEETPRRESVNENENMTSKKEPDAKPSRPDWLGRLLRNNESRRGAIDPPKSQQQVVNTWPESVIKSSQVNRNASISGRADPMPRSGQRNQDEAGFQGDKRQSTPLPPALKEKKVNRVGYADRGWPGWFPMPREGKEQAKAQNHTLKDVPQSTGAAPLQLTLQEKEKSRLSSADRMWPSWFPLQKNETLIPVLSEQSVRRETSKDASEETTSNKTVSRAPVTVTLPSMNALHTFRDWFQQSRPAEEEEKQEPPVASSDESLDGFEFNNPDRIESHPTRIVPSLSGLREISMNAATFIRRLPWSPIRNEIMKGSDNRQPKDSDGSETTVVQSEDSSKQRATVNIDTEQQRRDVSKRNETMAPTKQRQQTLRALPNPIKAFNFVRSLPWTPGNVDPSLSKQVTTRNDDSAMRKSSNPVKFIRGLPWTPRRHKREEKHDNQRLELLGSDDSKGLAESQDEESQAIFDKSREQTQKQGNENKGTTLDGSVKKLQLAQVTALPNETSEVAEDDAELAKNEIEDIVRKYLKRNKGSVDSEGEDNGMQRPSPEQTGGEVEVIEYKDTDSIHTYAERRYRESDDGRNDERTNNRSTEKTAEKAINSGNRNVESASQRQQQGPKKRESAPNPGESDESVANNNAPSSNMTSTPNQMDDQSPESSTHDSTPLTNTTSSPVRHDETPPTDSASRRQEEQIRQQQPQPTMIIMGGPHDGRPMQGTRNVVRPLAPSSSIIFAEAIGSIVSAVVRIWLISFFAKWWSEEEVLRPVQHFVYERLNDRYQRDKAALQTVLQMPPENVSERQWRRYLRRQHRAEGKVKTKQTLSPQMFQRTVVVLEIGGELNLPHLEQAVTFILSQHREQAFGNIGGFAKELEVVLLIESPGGAVQDYGLAAALVERLSREAGLTVIACVDKVAASGGYMIASQAHNILAAPFATVGSIGVIREGLNIHDALQRYGIKGLVLKAGDSKVPLTMLGKVTSSDVAKAQRTLDTMHKAFQQLVARGRPQLGNIDDVCNGDIYFGELARSLSLVDRIVTSEEYLLERIRAGDRVMKLHRAPQYVVGRRKLFHPLDFLRERSAPLRAACGKWKRSDLESMFSHVAAATSVLGTVQFLAQYGRDSGLR